MREMATSDMTMIVVTHEMGFAREVADRMMMFDGGAIVEEGSPAQMFEAPTNDRTKLFLPQIQKRKLGYRSYLLPCPVVKSCSIIPFS